MKAYNTRAQEDCCRTRSQSTDSKQHILKSQKRVTKKIRKPKQPTEYIRSASPSQQSPTSIHCQDITNSSSADSQASTNIFSAENSNNSQTSYYDSITGVIDTTNLTHEEFLKVVRTQAKKAAQSKKTLQSSQNIFVQQYFLEKSCEICRSFMDDEHMLLCDYCDDAYHSYCLDPPLTELPGEDEDWVCKHCQTQKEKLDKKKEQKVRQSYLEEHNFRHHKKNNSTTSCNKCSNLIQDDKSKENCIKCRNYFHKNCFNSKKNTIVCNDCSELIQKEIPNSQTELTQYFQIKKKYQKQMVNKRKQLRLSSPTKPSQKQMKRENQGLFKLPVSSKDPNVTAQQKRSLIYSLKAKNIEFDDDLQFSQDCPSNSNDTSLEPNLQVISKQNLEIFLKFKEMTRRGEYAPVIIEEDKIQGFVVRALEDIPERTLICEYVGQVDKMKNRVFDDNDSIMELLKTARSSTTLVIVPQKYGNLARFLSGINNSSKESKKKQNVQSIRMDINGHARVLLYSKRKILKNEFLYYDYNAGGFDDYPTENFV